MYSRPEKQARSRIGQSRQFQLKRKRRRRVVIGGIALVAVIAAVVWRDAASPAKKISQGHAHPVSKQEAASYKKSDTAAKQTPTKPTPVRTPTSLPPSKLLRVAAQSQLPQLPNGCEVTSLSMLLNAVGHPVNKMLLAQEEPKDPTKRVYGPHGSTVYWGNPNVGFVGSVYQYANGFGIYHGPIAKFINQLLPGRAEDLTGRPFSDILSVVAHGTPVMLWTTATFQPTNMWTSWNTPEGPIRVTLQEHVVLLVGYNQTQLFVNNPLNGEQAQAVNRQQFLQAWNQLGDQAVTIAPAKAQ